MKVELTVSYNTELITGIVDLSTNIRLWRKLLSVMNTLAYYSTLVYLAKVELTVSDKHISLLKYGINYSLIALSANISLGWK